MFKFLAVMFSSFVIFSGYAGAASVDGAEIHWESSGDGPAIVFVHGNRRDGTDWSSQVAEFKEEYRVITLDLPGHGQSEALSEVVNSSIPWGGSLNPLAEAIESVRAETGIQQMVLVGHSLGGWVIGEYMVHYPQYVAAVVGADSEFHGRPQARYERTITREDLIESPALIVLAEDGVILRRGGQPADILQRYPRGRIEIMPDTRHDVMLDNSTEFNRLLREFLEEIEY